MTPIPDKELLIGVDGGATEVKAHEVLVLSAGERQGKAAERARLGLGSASASCIYDSVAGFEPIPIARQLVEQVRGEIRPSEPERAAGDAWIEAIAVTVLSVASQAGGGSVRVGICLPGLKTTDRRGTAVVRHGPRIPDFLDRLEARLLRDGLDLAAPIPMLLGDGDACGLGEEADAHGLFRDVADAYYIGGGTGVAECFKLAGRVTGLDELRGTCKKAWELESSSGRNFDDAVSVGGINRAYVERSGAPPPIDVGEFPEQRALRGDPIALEVVGEAARALAELILDRILLAGAGSRTRTSRRRSPTGARAFPANTVFERVVLGQRLGRLYGEPSLRRVFRAVVDDSLLRALETRVDPSLRERYLDGAVLRAGFLMPSLLRAAPAIGAAAHALASVKRSPAAAKIETDDAPASGATASARSRAHDPVHQPPIAAKDPSAEMTRTPHPGVRKKRG